MPKRLITEAEVQAHFRQVAGLYSKPIEFGNKHELAHPFVSMDVSLTNKPSTNSFNPFTNSINPFPNPQGTQVD